MQRISTSFFRLFKVILIFSSLNVMIFVSLNMDSATAAVEYAVLQKGASDQSNRQLMDNLDNDKSSFEASVEAARERLFGFGDANYRIYMSRLPQFFENAERLSAVLGMQLESLESAWQGIEPEFGLINTDSLENSEHRVIAYDPDHYQNIVSLETSSDSQKLWMWDLELKSVYALHSEANKIHQINEVLYAPWKRKQLVIFGDVTISLLDLDWAANNEPYGVHFTSSKIIKILDLGNESKKIAFLTKNGRIGLLGKSDKFESDSDVSLLASFDHPGAFGMMVHPYLDGLVITYSEGEIKVWDVRSHTQVSSIALEPSMVSGNKHEPIFLSANPDQLLIWSDIGKLHRFDLESGQRIYSRPIHWSCARSVTDWRVTDDSKHLIVLCESDLLRIYDTNTLDLLQTIQLHHKGYKGEISLRGDRFYVWFNETSFLFLFDTKTFNRIGLISEECEFMPANEKPELFCIDPEDHGVFKYLEFYKFDHDRLVSSNGEALFFWRLDESSMQALPIDSDSDPSLIQFHMHPKNPNLIFSLDNQGYLQYWDFWSQAALSFPNTLE